MFGKNLQRADEEYQNLTVQQTLVARELVALRAYIQNGPFPDSNLIKSPACVCVSTGPLPSCTYSNLTLTLTADLPGVFTIDGVTPTFTQSILVNGQSNAAQNGIYTMVQEGTVAVPFVLKRRSDFDQPTNMLAGSSVYVLDGTTYTDTYWILPSSVLIVGISPVGPLIQQNVLSNLPIGANLTKAGGVLNTVDNPTFVSVKLTGGAQNAYVLTSDASGNATWAPPPASGVSSITGTANQVIASSPTGAVTLSLPQSIATTSNVQFNKVTVADFQLTTAPTAGYVLSCDASGNATWVAPSGGGGVGSITGTVNQVIASSSTGAVTLSLPQDIALTSTPQFSSLKLTTGAANNYLLKSDASGNTSWTDLASVGVSSVTGTADQVIVSSSTGAVTLSLPQSIATTSTVQFGKVGIGMAAGNALDVNGKTSTSTFQLITGAVNGYILSSDASGNATWSALSGLGVTSITGTTNQIIASNPTGAVTLSLPQSIATTSTPTFAALQLTTGASLNFILKSDASGNTSWAALSTLGVTSITGTTNQVIASSSTGAVTLSLPQSIATSSTPTFAALQLTTGAGNNLVLKSDASGNTSWAALSTLGVSSITGTTNQVIASSSTGAVTLSLPQSIATSSTPTFAALQLTTGASLNFILKSDASGNTSWAALSTLGVTSITGTTNQVIASGSTGAVTLSLPQSIATTSTVQFGKVGIGGAATNALDVVGKTSTTTFQLTTTPTAGYVLSCDASGNGSWTALSGLGVTSITGTTNQVIASSSTGAVTLSLPQSIATTSTPTFAALQLTTGAALNFILKSNASGNTSWAALSTLGVSSITGTTNQVIASNSTGAVTLSLPQSIATTSTPTFAALQLTTGAALNFILKSDASGNTSWAALSTLGVSSITGTTNQVIASSSTGAVTLSLPQSIATSSTVQFGKVGIGGAATNALDVVGKTSTTTFQLTTAPTAGYVLSCDASGNGSWTALSSLGVTSITGTTNQVIASSSTGAVTLSLPQSIATTSTPTFAALQLTTGAGANLILKSDASGNTSWTALSTLGVTSITGTTNQVIASNSTGAVTLSLPQSIATTSTPQFGGLAIGTVLPTGCVLNVSGTQTVAFSGTQVYGSLFNSTCGVATIANASTLNVVPQFSGGGVITSAYGLKIDAMTLSGVGSITTAYGMYVTAPTVGGTNLAAYLGGAVTVSGKLTTTTFQLTTGANAGYVMVSDGSGNGTWTLFSSIGVTSITGTTNQVIASNSTGAVTLSLPQSIATSSTVQFGKVGIGGAATNALDVVGKTSTTTFQITTTPTAGYVLSCDASGNGSWTALSLLGVTSITGTTNQVIASSNTGAVTLSLPQSIATTSSPTFAALQLTTGAGANLILKSDATGNTSWAALSTLGVSSITGTTNQVIASSGTGAVTLSLPQSIATSSTVQFGKVGIGGAATNALDVVGKTTTTTFQLTTTPTAGYVLSCDASGNGSWTALSTLGVTSITGTTNQVIASSSTGAVTLSLPQSIATSSTVQFGALGLGVASPLATLQVSGSGYFYFGGNVADAGGDVSFGIGSFPAYTPMSQVKGILFNATASELQGGIAFLTRPFGTAGQVLTERMRISYNGNVAIGTTTVSNAKLQISCTTTQSQAYGLYVTGTMTGTSGATCVASNIDAALTPPASLSNAVSQYIYPNFAPPSGVTITTGIGLYVGAGTQSGAGSVTDSYAMYVEAPSYGTNKSAAFLGGKVGISGPCYVGIASGPPFSTTPLLMTTQTLGTTAGNSVLNLSLNANDSNSTRLQFSNTRSANGTDHTTDSIFIQRYVDVSAQGYMKFTAATNSWGWNTSDFMTMTSDGNFGFSTSTVFTGGNPSLTLTSGNTLIGLQGVYTNSAPFPDDFYVSNNYNFATASVLNSNYGTSAIDVGAAQLSTGGYVTFYTGATGAAPSLRLTINTSGLLIANSTSGYAAGTLDWYETYNTPTTVSFTGIWSSPSSATVYITRIGKMCTLVITTVLQPASVASIITSVSAVIPARLRPPTTQQFPVFVQDDNINQNPGLLLVGSNGFLTIYSTTVSGVRNVQSNFLGTSVSENSGWSNPIVVQYLMV